MNQPIIDVSIVVPCRNEESYISGFVESVFSQQLNGLGIQLIVADGMSTDNTRSILMLLCKQYPSLLVIDNPEKIVSTALNRAILASQSLFIVRMDVHTDYSSDYIYQSILQLRNSGASCVGGPWQACGKSLNQSAIAFAFQTRLGGGFSRTRSTNYQGPVESVYLGAWHRLYLIKIGLFDEKLVRNQDDELALRIRLKGDKIIQFPSIKSSYFPRDSFSRLFMQYYQYGFWKTRVLAKHLKLSQRNLILLSIPLFLIVLSLLSFTSMQARITVGLTVALYLILLLVQSFPFVFAYHLAPIHSFLLVSNAILVMHASYSIGLLYGLTTLVFPFCLSSTSVSRLSR